MSNLDKNNARAWSNYWETGFESTFTGHEKTGFFTELNESWLQELSALADGSTIVDLGAGNGAITSLAVDINEDSGKNLNIVAVDYAEIESYSPIFEKKIETLTVKGRTKIEATGLPDDSVDLCVSQFGYEYADIDLAAQEVWRILKPGGSLNAVVHHRRSEVSQSCASAHMQIGLCNRSKLTTICSKLIKRLRKLDKSKRDPSQDETAENLRNELNKRTARVIEHATRLPDQSHVNYFITELTGLFSSQAEKLSFMQKLAIIDKVEKDSESFRLRMEAMLNASLDEQKVEALENALVKSGFESDGVKLLEHEHKIYAWRVKVNKPLK